MPAQANQSAPASDTPDRSATIAGARTIAIQTTRSEYRLMHRPRESPRRGTFPMRSATMAQKVPGQENCETRITHHPRDERQRQTHPGANVAARRLNRVGLSHGLCLQSLQRKRRSKSEDRWPLQRVSDLAPSADARGSIVLSADFDSRPLHTVALFSIETTDLARWIAPGCLRRDSDVRR